MKNINFYKIIKQHKDLQNYWVESQIEGFKKKKFISKKDLVVSVLSKNEKMTNSQRPTFKTLNYKALKESKNFFFDSTIKKLFVKDNKVNVWYKDYQNSSLNNNLGSSFIYSKYYNNLAKKRFFINNGLDKRPKKKLKTEEDTFLYLDNNFLTNKLYNLNYKNYLGTLMLNFIYKQNVFNNKILNKKKDFIMDDAILIKTRKNFIIFYSPNLLKLFFFKPKKLNKILNLKKRRQKKKWLYLYVFFFSFFLSIKLTQKEKNLYK